VEDAQYVLSYLLAIIIKTRVKY